MATTPNHLDNFGTNLTSNTNAGDSTSPINSVPSIDAPFYMAFDATNTNGHYELKLITSKIATNVNHSNLSYAHTTAEEVRIVNPAQEFDMLQHSPQGYLRGGKIVPSVASNNLTVALKTIAGADPSATDPVSVRIGDNELLITSALSVTKNAGTNWCNSGSAELATKEIDYFVYLGYNATDGVTIGFSRIPSANQYSDFSVTTTNEKYCAISTISNAASTDYYENVGRFAATLSAGAGYTWSVPTFTAVNLIQRPIFETRRLLCAVVHTGFSANPTYDAAYKLVGNRLYFYYFATSVGTSNATTFIITMPFSSLVTDYLPLQFGQDAGVNTTVTPALAVNTNQLTFNKGIGVNPWTASGNKYAYFDGSLLI